MTTPEGDLLRRAADKIEMEGWTQHHFSDARGLCAIVALSACKQTGDIYYAAAKILRGMIDEVLITEWNDRPDQTAENVIATMRRAADLADTQVTP